MAKKKNDAPVCARIVPAGFKTPPSLKIPRKQIMARRSKIALFLFRSPFPADQVFLDFAYSSFPVFPQVSHPYDANVDPPFETMSTSFP